MPLGENDPIEQGEIYWVTIPNKGGREQHGRRPCIVMSRRTINNGNPIMVVPMTSQMHKASAYNIAIPVNEIVKDLASNSIPVGSVALCGHAFVIDKRKLEDRLGKLSFNAVLAVQLGLAYVFDIR